MKNKDNELYLQIRAFLKDYLPEKRNCSPHTIKAYRTALDQLLEYIKRKNNIHLIDITFETINREAVTGYLDHLENERSCSPGTRNYRLNCLRAFFDFAVKTDKTLVAYQIEISGIPFKKIPKDESIDYLPENAVKVLLYQPDVSRPKGIRDQFLMVLMYDSGARIQEIINISVCDICLGDTPQVKLHGKGGKRRVVPLMKETIQHFHRYMRAFHADEPLYSEKPLFYTVRNGICKPISDDMVRVFMDQYAQQAHKVCAEVPEKIHPHLLRHSRAMHLYQHGMPLSLISQWLGHAHLSSTLVYAHADTEMKRKAIEKATDKYFPAVDPEHSPYDVNDDEILKRLYGLKP